MRRKAQCARSRFFFSERRREREPLRREEHNHTTVGLSLRLSHYVTTQLAVLLALYIHSCNRKEGGFRQLSWMTCYCSSYPLGNLSRKSGKLFFCCSVSTCETE
ncbi:unnamed protein product [Coccothraustes coccothraustes]